MKFGWQFTLVFHLSEGRCASDADSTRLVWLVAKAEVHARIYALKYYGRWQPQLGSQPVIAVSGFAGRFSSPKVLLWLVSCPLGTTKSPRSWQTFSAQQTLTSNTTASSACGPCPPHMQPGKSVANRYRRVAAVSPRRNTEHPYGVTRNALITLKVPADWELCCPEFTRNSRMSSSMHARSYVRMHA